MKNISTFRSALLTGVCLVLPLFAMNVRATICTWEEQGTSTSQNNGSGFWTGSLSGTWENSEWTTAANTSSSTHGNQIKWIENTAALFAVATGTGTPAFTVTMNSNHTVAGFFNGDLGPNPCTVTIQGPGTIFIAGPGGALWANLQGVTDNGGHVSSGDPAVTTFDNVIAGTLANASALTPQDSGYMSLFATNTYASGTCVGYSGLSFNGIVYFNNAASFGTGPIGFSNCLGGALVYSNTPGTLTSFTVPNTITSALNAAQQSVNIVGTPGGITFGGPWTLNNSANALTSAIKIGSGGSAGTLVILGGVISGSGGIIAWNTANLELNAANTYSGPTWVSNTCVLTLGPNGSITGTGLVTVQTNAALADTNTSGASTIAGAVTFQGASTGEAAARAIFNGSGSSVGSISVGGNLTLATTPVTVNVTGTALAPGAYTLISCAGSVSGSAATTPTITGIALPAGEAASVSTTTGSGGSVVLTVTAPPTLGCPGNITDVSTGSCGQTESFAATVTNGYPTSTTVSYNLGSPTGTAITSPYFFPVGTTTVYVSAANSVGTNTCSFTVTINDNLTAPNNLPFGAQAASVTTLNLARFFGMCSSSLTSPSYSLVGVASPTPAGATVSLNGSGTVLTYTATGTPGSDTVNYVLSDGCTTTTNQFAVNVTPPQGGNFGSATMDNSGDLVLTFYGVPGTTYYLQSASAVGGPYSNTGQAAQASSNGTITFIILPPLPSPSYYRTTTVGPPPS